MEEQGTEGSNSEKLIQKSQEQVIPVAVVVEPTEESLTNEVHKTNLEIQKQEGVVFETTNEVNSIRHDLDAPGEEINIPSLVPNKEAISKLENKKLELEKKLEEILKSNTSENYQNVIDEVKQSKIDWAHSDELARRLKLKGATEEDILQVRNWLIDNTTSAKTFVLPPHKFQEAINVLHEMSDEENLQEHIGAFHVSGGRTDVPDFAKDAVYIKEKIAPPPLPGKEKVSEKIIDINEVHHEFGHVAQNGLLESELYNDWDPKFKEGAPDKEYIGLIKETDTRIRSMYRELGEAFDPNKEVFGKKHLELLRNKLKNGAVDKDVKDLFDHYDDVTIMKFANHLPAI